MQVIFLFVPLHRRNKCWRKTQQIHIFFTI
nr:MAG TPA: hypothetical protein [Caudoviricetes sp.]